MITKAQSSIEAVSAFAQSVSAATDYSGKLDTGIACLEELFRQLSELANVLLDDAAQMTSAQGMLAEKIISIEEIIAKYTAQINALDETLSGLEEQLANTPESISLTNAEGETYEISNPAYDAISIRISAIEGEINVIRAEMHPHQIRLERANSVNSQITVHKDAVNGVIYSLQEKKNACKQLLEEIRTIQKQNLAQGNYAVAALMKIQRIIESYLAIKMVYEGPESIGQGLGNKQAGVTVSISISRDTIIQEQKVVESLKEHYDDRGEKYRIGDNLLPNITYEINGYKYGTDDKGRVISAGGKLRIKDSNYVRKMEDVKKMEGQEYKTSDDRGHLIAHQFGGSDKLGNLVPMDANLNKGDFARLENTLNDALQNGADVILKVKPIYEPDSSRPSAFRVSYSIDGDRDMRVFRNESEVE